MDLAMSFLSIRKKYSLKFLDFSISTPHLITVSVSSVAGMTGYSVMQITKWTGEEYPNSDIEQNDGAVRRSLMIGAG